ncbi:MAG TPA: hypothetical protein VF175_16050, partial [Lacipirellula sp.]
MISRSIENFYDNMHRANDATFASTPHAPSAALPLALGCILLTMGSRAAYAQLTYVDANRNTNTGPAIAIKAGVNGQADDNLWSERTGFSSGGNFFQSGDGNGEDAPQLTSTITGLAPSTLYSVYVHFWDAGPAWTIRAGYAAGKLPLYASPAEAAATGAEAALLASTLGYSRAPTVFVEADRTMYAAPIGPAKSDPSGTITFYVDDRPSSIGVNHRTWYDGMSYEPASVLTLQVNTATGAVSIRNDAGSPFDLNYYEIRSPTGALDPAQWLSLDDQDPVSGDAAWNEAGGSAATKLSEFNVLGMTTVAAASTESLGDAFTAGATLDLTFHCGVVGGTQLHSGYVEYVTGLDGDFDGDDDVDGGDLLRWQRGESPTAMSAADLAAWTANYGAALSQAPSAVATPEPAGGVLILFSALAFVHCRKDVRD